VDNKTFTKYEEFTFLMALKADPNVLWCPNPKGCGNAIYRDENDGSRNTKVICNQCKYEFCSECMEEVTHAVNLLTY
jgi:hypothetical protein